MAKRTLSYQRQIAILLFLIAALGPSWHSYADSTDQADDAETLVKGVPIERELAPGEVHSYQITLAAGEYLRCVIEQRGVLVMPQLFAPDKTPITSAFSAHSPKGPISVTLIAEAAGTYRLEIKVHGKDAKGRYGLEVKEQRLATWEDKNQLAAERLFQEGERLKQGNTMEERLSGIAKLEEAAALWRENSNRKGEVRALTAIGIGYEFGGELQTAMDYYQRGVALAQSAGNRPAEANLLLSMGRIHFFFGDRQKALDSFNRSAQLYNQSGQRYGEALALASLGTTYFSMGDLVRGLEYHERTLPVFPAVGDPGNECMSLNHLGDIYLAMGDKQKALESYTRAVALARQIKNAQFESISLRNLASFYLSQDDKPQALRFFNQALKIGQIGGYKINEAILHRSIGNVAFMLGDTERALNSLTQALNQFQSIRFTAEEANTLHSLARVNLSRGNLSEARKQIEMSLDIKESLRAPIVDRDLRISSIASIQNSYSFYINLLMQLHQKQPAEGHDLAALKASEHARVRGLLELLIESGAEIRQGVSPELLALERSLQRELNAKAALRTKQRDDVQGALLDKQLSQLTSRYREVEAHIRATSPRYAALTQPQPLSVAEIQQLLDEESVLLEFSLGEEASWLWVVTPKRVTSHRLPQRAEVESAARKVYDLLIARQPKAGLTEAEQTARIKEADARFQSEAAALSRMLFGQIAGPLRQELKGKRLLIVPSGALEYLPFAALPIPSVETGYQPLIAGHEIVNLPSASVLSVIRRETAGRAAAPGTVAILADPVFEANDPRLLLSAKRRADGQEIALNTGPSLEAGSSAAAAANHDSLRPVRGVDGGKLSRLPFSGEEADAIAELVPARLRIKATDFQATRARALSSELSNYRIVHFATHGLLNSQHPELSGLVLSLVDENGKAQDGFLRMHEIYNLRLPAEVVVLSACQTGLGKEIKGEGLIGLTRGFMYAGAQRVVASLWQVDDRATAGLMKHFYQAMLKDGLRPAAALRSAQLELMKEKRWSSPYFWAAFVMQGEWK